MLHYTTYLRYFCRSADCLPWPLIGLYRRGQNLRVTNLTRPGGSSWQLLLDTNLSYERISCMLFSKSQQKILKYICLCLVLLNFLEFFQRMFGINKWSTHPTQIRCKYVPPSRTATAIAGLDETRSWSILILCRWLGDRFAEYVHYLEVKDLGVEAFLQNGLHFKCRR